MVRPVMPIGFKYWLSTLGLKIVGKPREKKPPLQHRRFAQRKRSRLTVERHSYAEGKREIFLSMTGGQSHDHRIRSGIKNVTDDLPDIPGPLPFAPRKIAKYYTAQTVQLTGHLEMR